MAARLGPPKHEDSRAETVAVKRDGGQAMSDDAQYSIDKLREEEKERDKERAEREWQMIKTVGDSSRVLYVGAARIIAFKLFSINPGCLPRPTAALTSSHSVISA
jgi:CHASE3 domain sensor protein